MGKQTISSRMRSQCTYFPAYGMRMNGQHEGAWKRLTGRRLRLFHLTRISVLMDANGKIPTLNAYQQPLRIGGINTMPGISLILRNWTMLGFWETLLFMIIARILKDFQPCPSSVHWVHGIDWRPTPGERRFIFIYIFFNFLFFILNFGITSMKMWINSFVTVIVFDWLLDIYLILFHYHLPYSIYKKRKNVCYSLTCYFFTDLLLLHCDEM